MDLEATYVILIWLSLKRIRQSRGCLHLPESTAFYIMHVYRHTDFLNFHCVSLHFKNTFVHYLNIYMFLRYVQETER